MQRNPDKCREMQRSAEKFREMQRNEEKYRIQHMLGLQKRTLQNFEEIGACLRGQCNPTFADMD